MMIHLFEILASLTESALGIAVPAKLLGEKRSGGIRLAAAEAVLTAVVWGINQYVLFSAWTTVLGVLLMALGGCPGLPEEFCGRAAADCIFYVSFVCL